MNTTSERCESCQGVGTIPTHRSRWIGGGKTGYRSEGAYDVRCDDCNGMGSSESAPITVSAAFAPLITAVKAGNVMDAYRVVDTLIPSPVFASWDDFAAFHADDLRDAVMDHDADDSEVA